MSTGQRRRARRARVRGGPDRGPGRAPGRPGHGRRDPAGQRLFDEGGLAASLWLIRSGQIALDLRVPGRDRLIVETLGPGDELGLSWLMPAARVAVRRDRAGRATAVFELSSAALTNLCETDHELGYQLTRRLLTTAISPTAGRADPHPRPIRRADTARAEPRHDHARRVPASYRISARREETHDTVSITLEPAGEPIADFRPGQFTMLYAFGVGEIPVSVSGPAGVSHADADDSRGRRGQHGPVHCACWPGRRRARAIRHQLE